MNREEWVEVLTGNRGSTNAVEIATLALEIAAAEARAIVSFGSEAADDTQTILARALLARIQAVRMFIAAEGDWTKSQRASLVKLSGEQAVDADAEGSAES